MLEEEKKKEEKSSCTKTLPRIDSEESLTGFKTPIMSVSESDSDASLVTVSSGVASKSKRRRSEGEDGSDDDAPLAKVTPARRGRGRPPTTGQYVGLAKAKAKYNVELRNQLRLDAERELDAELRERKVPGSETAETLEGRDVVELERLLGDSMEQVKSVALKSGNLKGTFVKELKNAAETAKNCFEALRRRTVAEETRLLADANTRLKAEVEVLRRELNELRSSMRPTSTTVQAPALVPDQLPVDEMMRSVMVQVGTMLNARLAGLEERLLPEQRVRPPLAADSKREAAARAAPTEDFPPLPPPRTPAKPAEATKKRQIVAKPATKTTAHPPAVVEEPWTVVTRKGSRRSKQKRSDPPAKPAPKPAPQSRSQPAPTKPAKQVQPVVAKAPRLRPPRTAAVVITLQPEAMERGLSYAKVIAEAKSRIDLGALGVTNIRMRTAATGAKVIEVPGAERVEQADSLAGRLREVFEATEDVKISRPVTTVDLRVSGLDDSIDSTELVEAIAKAGSCSAEAIKAGLIRQGAGGMGTAVVRCPVTAARVIMARGRVLVGWVSAQVRLLEARPRRCFRCLVQGHVRAQCQSEVDRSDECYRCGQSGHKANGCSAAPHCTLCAASGKPADHLSGGKACAKPPAKKARGARAATEATAKSQPSRPPREQPVRMEES